MEQEIIIGIIVAFVSGIFGWSLSQLTIGRKISEKVGNSMNEMNLTIQRVENDNNRTKDELAALRTHTASEVSSMSTLVEKVLDTANKLIDVVQIQNALLNQKFRSLEK